MPVTVRAALLLVVALALGCSGGGDTPADGGPVDAGGQTDAGLHCFDRDAGSCTVQADCLTTDSEGSTHVYACEDAFCAVQAQFNATCHYDLPTASVQVAKSPAMAAQPASIELRAFYPTNVDGTALACADLLGTADFPDGGSALQLNANLNLQSMGAYQATSCGGGSCIYVLNTNLVSGSAPLILAQAYTGGRDVTGVHAMGTRLGEGCVAAGVIGSDTTVNVTVAP